jgi:hypothetical protein
MTNKQELPVIGKRYKANNGNIFKITKEEKKYFLLTSEETGQSYPYDSLEIQERFEELPDQESTNPNNLTEEEEARELEFCTNPNDKVQEALKKAKATISGEKGGYKTDNLEENYLCALENLVNAIEQQNLEQKNKEEADSCTVEKASKSIWKPMSELQKDTPTCQILYKEDGQIRSGVFKYFIDDDMIIESFWEGEPQVLSYLYDIKEFCTLTDFITHQESLERRIERLELLTNK